MHVAIDNQSERALVLDAVAQRRRRMDKPIKEVMNEARDLARADLLAALMSAQPGELNEEEAC